MLSPHASFLLSSHVPDAGSVGPCLCATADHGFSPYALLPTDAASPLLLRLNLPSPPRAPLHRRLDPCRLSSPLPEDNAARASPSAPLLRSSLLRLASPSRVFSTAHRSDRRRSLPEPVLSSVVLLRRISRPLGLHLPHCRASAFPAISGASLCAAVATRPTEFFRCPRSTPPLSSSPAPLRLAPSHGSASRCHPSLATPSPLLPHHRRPSAAPPPVASLPQTVRRRAQLPPSPLLPATILPCASSSILLPVSPARKRPKA